MKSEFLARIDAGLILWAAIVSLIVALFRVTGAQRHELRGSGQVHTHWSLVLLNAVAGGLVGGVACALIVPDIWPKFNTPGGISVAAMSGAAIVPIVFPMLPHIVSSVITWYSKHKFGVTIRTREGEDDAK